MSVNGKICINEVLQSNMNGVMDDYNEFPDSWVEIYNDGVDTFDFTNYSISKTLDFTESYPILDSTLIAPHGYLLIYCDGEEYGGNHADFKLDTDEESMVYIFTPDGHVLDSLRIPVLLASDISYGRISDGNDTLSYFKNPTPGSANKGFYTDKILKKPNFSKKAGIYKSPFYVKLSLQGKYPQDAVVRYTTNGSEPKESSPIATDSILISKTTVLRAKTFSDSALSKESKTQTYIIPEREYHLPIISITTDSSFLYDDELGILVEGTYGSTHPDAVSDVPVLGSSNYLFSWNRPANIEYFDLNKDSSCVINQLVEIEIGGNTSPIYCVKSLNVRARKRFGENKFSYPFWSDKPNVTKCKALYLRNAGQDIMEIHMRDALDQMIGGQNVDLDWQACQPVVVLLNGKYYGMLNLREKADKDFIWSNYNKLEDIDLIYENNYNIKAGDLVDFYKYHASLVNQKTSYEEYDKLIDLNEFSNYYILNTCFSNRDFPANNQLLWKKRDSTSKWRFIAKDMDVSCGLWMNDSVRESSNYPYLNYILGTDDYKGNYTVSYNTAVYKLGFIVFRRMTSLPKFRNDFIDRFSVYLGTFLSVKQIMASMDSLSNVMEPEIPYFYDEIGRPTLNWIILKNRYKHWITARIPYLYSHLRDVFSIGDTTSLSIHTVRDKLLYFNGIKIKDGTFDGSFFENRPFYLSRKDSTCSYVGDNLWIDSADSISNSADGCWYIKQTLNDSVMYLRRPGKSLYYSILQGVKNVHIADSYEVDIPDCDDIPAINVSLDHSQCRIAVSEIQIPERKTTDTFGDTITGNLYFDVDSLSIGEYKFNWIYTDILGDSTFCKQNIIISSKVPIVLDNCEHLDTLKLDVPVNDSVISVKDLISLAPVANGVCDEPLYAIIDVDTSALKVGINEVKWVFEDSMKNTLVCPQTILVVDTVKPTLEVCDSMSVLVYGLTDSSCAKSIDDIVLPTLMAFDNCDGNIIGELSKIDSVYIGENLVYWNFIDKSGNLLQCRQIITIVDSFAPVVDCEKLENKTIAIKDNSCSFNAFDLIDSIPSVFATDNCGKFVVGHLSGNDTLYLGENSIRWNYVDESNNQSYCEQTITLVDSFAPYFDCSSLPILIYTIKDSSTCVKTSELKLKEPIAIDNCDRLVQPEMIAEECLAIGKDSIRWYFTDDVNVSVCPQYIVVADSFAPWHQNCDSLPMLVYPITDNVCSIQTNSLNIPVPQAFDNESMIDGLLVADDSLTIGRNEIYWNFTDNSNNTTFCHQSVILEDKFAPTINCDTLPVKVISFNDNRCDTLYLPEMSDYPFALDNCGTPIIGTYTDSTTYFGIGENEMGWAFIDNNGNTSYCHQKLTVFDEYAPKIDCSSLSPVLLELDESIVQLDDRYIELPIPVATDNCDTYIDGVVNNIEHLRLGDKVVEWVFADVYGNKKYCKQEVIEKASPVMIFPNPTKDNVYIVGAEDGANIILMDITGKIMAKYIFDGCSLAISLSDYEKGVYVLMIDGESYLVEKN